MKKIRIALVDDHPIFTDSMSQWIASKDRFINHWTANNGYEALDNLLKFKTLPHILIMDINMPGMDGCELLQSIKKRYKQIKVIVLSMYNNSVIVTKMIRCGANAYLVKSNGADEIEKAILETYEKGQYYNALVVDSMKLKIRNLQSEVINHAALKGNLKDIEIRVIELICKELTNVEIADRLCRSVRTIETIRKKVMYKIGAKNTAGVVKFAIKENLSSI